MKEIVPNYKHGAYEKKPRTLKCPSSVRLFALSFGRQSTLGTLVEQLFVFENIVRLRGGSKNLKNFGS